MSYETVPTGKFVYVLVHKPASSRDVLSAHVDTASMHARARELMYEDLANYTHLDDYEHMRGFLDAGAVGMVLDTWGAFTRSLSRFSLHRLPIQALATGLDALTEATDAHNHDP